MLTKKLNSNGTKAVQRGFGDARMLPYKEFHSALGRPYYMQDVDTVEYRYENGVLRVAALVEITRADMDKDVNDKYLNGILERFKLRDAQGALVTTLADKLNVHAYVTLFRADCSTFWVYDLTEQDDWAEMTPDEYATFLKGL